MNRYEYENWIEIDYDKVLETTDMTLEEAKARLEITYKASGFIKKDEGYYVVPEGEDSFDYLAGLIYLATNKEKWIPLCAKIWKSYDEEDGEVDLLEEYNSVKEKLRW